MRSCLQRPAPTGSLHVSFCGLASLAREVSSLSRLEGLELAGNAICDGELPADLATLQGCRFLDLADTGLQRGEQTGCDGLRLLATLPALCHVGLNVHPYWDTPEIAADQLAFAELNAARGPHLPRVENGGENLFQRERLVPGMLHWGAVNVAVAFDQVLGQPLDVELGDDAMCIYR